MFKEIANWCVLSKTFCIYVLNSGFNASPKHTAFAAIIFSRGPPWVPGNIALLTFSIISLLLVNIKPPSRSS